MILYHHLHQSLSHRPTLALLKQKKGFYSFVLILPTALFALSCVLTARLSSLAKECEDAVGIIASCAKEKYYFDIPGGISGNMQCNFGSVRTLICSDMAIEVIVPSICSNMPQLRHVDFSNNGLGADSFAAAVTLAHAIGSNRSLVYLKLDYNRLGRHAGVAFASALHKNRTLEVRLFKLISYIDHAKTHITLPARRFYRWPTTALTQMLVLHLLGRWQKTR